MKTRFTFWRKAEVSAKGVEVVGDEKMPSTPNNVFLLLWHVFFVWNKSAVIQVSIVPESGYRIGFRNAFGEVRVMTLRWVKDKRFAMRLGRESFHVFVFGPSGEEIPIEVIASPVDQHDPYFNEVPLF